METHEYRTELCPNPACGMEKGTNPNCPSCNRHNKREEHRAPSSEAESSGEGITSSEVWKETKKKLGIH